MTYNLVHIKVNPIKNMKATTTLQAKVELPPALKFPLRADILPGITIPSLSGREKDLVEILQTNGGFYYTGSFPTLDQLEQAVVIRRPTTAEGTEWSWLYVRDVLHPEQSFNSFIPDLDIFSVVESSNWPYLPIMVLDFGRVMRKYGAQRLVNFLLQYQLFLRKPFTNVVTRSCTTTQDGRILGIEYGDVICNMDPLYIDVDLAEGQYTYLAAIVNGRISVGYKQCLHAEEIGSKHLCIRRKFLSMDPNAKAIIAGEVEYINKKFTYNMESGTFSPGIIVQTLDTLLNSTWPTDRDEFNTEEEDFLPIAGSNNAEQAWWIPLIKFIMFEGTYTNKPLISPASRLTTASAIKLCALSSEEKNLHEFGNIDMCKVWGKIEAPELDMAKLTYSQSFCHPSMDMRKFIGLRIVNLLLRERNLDSKDANSVIISPELSITSEVINIGSYAILLKALYKNDNAVVKIATTYNEKQALKKEMELLTELKGVPNLVTPLFYHSSPDKLDFIVYPYYNQGNLANFDSSMKLNTVSSETIFPIAVQIASFILAALEGIHAKGYLYLNVSFSNIVVDNFMISLKVALTDISLVQPIKMFEGEVPIQTIRNASSGTPYEAVALAKLIPPTFASDYESLGYLLYDLVYADLPWRRMTPTQAIALKENFNAKLFTSYFQVVRRGGTAAELLSALQTEEARFTRV